MWVAQLLLKVCGDTGFLMGLSNRVPDILARNLPAYLDGLLCRNDLTPDAIDFWAIHPGGPRVIDAVPWIP